ncbi:DegV family protein [Sulfoacidibacillus thermotolerans]|uniref:Fatty acid-binding protein DegV n=1 Tax=Sulfoacidibacillus thermotolerans TaxID=1765684 RepID=A0A2U3D7M3_SULT2|nr:DegV family protein [Sulfoacidibacillus thermotolerans]PWI57285.1 hypothetical protein BM613_09310 [Sulfoacidibacillus thermotolerans]
MRIAIVTDSTADLSPQEVAEYGITVVPLQIIFGEHAYRDGIDLTAAEFYAKLVNHKVLPTTSQPAVGDFVEAFQKLLESHDAIVGIFISSELSGTVRAAETAREIVSGEIAIVDSGMTAYALGIQVIEAAKRAQVGATVEEIVSRLQEVRERTSAYFVLDTFEYLRRGGRVGGAAAALGTLLQIKPVLLLRNKRIEVYEKVRTHKKALDLIVSRFVLDVQGKQTVYGAVVHGAAVEQAIALQHEVLTRVPDANLRVIELDPVIGVHVGPGVLALIYYAE